MSRYVPATTAAQYLRKSERSVHAYVEASKLTGFKQPGRRGLIIDLDEVDQAVANGVIPGVQYGSRANIKPLPANARVLVTAEPSPAASPATPTEPKSAPDPLADLNLSDAQAEAVGRLLAQGRQAEGGDHK